jgi:hypothetical protein
MTRQLTKATTWSGGVLRRLRVLRRIATRYGRLVRNSSRRSASLRRWRADCDLVESGHLEKLMDHKVEAPNLARVISPVRSKFRQHGDRVLKGEKTADFPVQQPTRSQSIILGRRLAESSRLFDDTHRAYFARLVDEGPIPTLHGVVRWRACDLIMWFYEEFTLSVSDDSIYRALKSFGFSHVNAWPISELTIALTNTLPDFGKANK